jgi:hypothetical protein
MGGVADVATMADHLSGMAHAGTMGTKAHEEWRGAGVGCQGLALGCSHRLDLLVVVELLNG